MFDLAGHLIAESDGSGAPIREYVWLGDMPVAVVDRTGTSPVTWYIHDDHLGRPRKLTDESGSVVWDGVFDPYGKVAGVSGAATNLLMFPGQYHDSETRLSQNWNRDYDPSPGCYVESDPIGLDGGINTYAYVGGNLVSKTDPYGRCFEDACVGEVAAGIGLWELIQRALGGGAIVAAGSLSGDKELCEEDKNICDKQFEQDYRRKYSLFPFLGNPGLTR